MLLAAASLQSCMFATAVNEASDLYVTTGTTWATLQDSLGAHGVKHPGRISGEGTPMPGRYKLSKGLNYRDLQRMMEHGYQTPVRVTFNNQHTLPQLAGRVAQQLEADSTALAEALLNDTMAVHYGLDNQTFIAIFMPDTYEFYWTAGPAEFIDKMHRQWERFWTDGRRDKLAEVGLTPVDATTLASIVYEETKVEEEMPRVAGVYINRLRLGMPLQADPTVKFAWMLTQPAGTEAPRRILNKHLAVDSPYNTYEHPGLPPGPIGMPSVAAIKAVIDYEKHDYLYFAARPDLAGRHNFATTLAEHNENAAAYRAAIR